MDRRALQYFVSSADLGSFTAAAASLRFSQPTLSEAVRQLERELRTPLFHRVGNGVVLTETGKVLLPKAREILQQFDEAHETMKALHGLQGGRVRIAAPPSLTVDPLARIIGRFLKHYPAVTLAMFPAEDGSLAVQAVSSGTCEVGVVDRAVPTPDLVPHLIARNEIMVVAPPGSPPGNSGRVPLQALAGRPFISTLPGTRTRTMLDEAQANGIDLPVVVETPHREAIIPLVLEGVGHAFLTSSMAREAEKRGATVLALEPVLTYGVYLIHRSKPLTRAAGAFVEQALQPR